MTSVTYHQAPLRIRDNLVESHQYAFDRWAQPGAWWTAAERLAIVEEGRQALRCTLCQQRQAALSPYSVTGEHDHTDRLDPVGVDIVHRVRTDPGRLAKSWFDSVIAAGIPPAAYVELIGVLTVSIIIDTLTESLGLPFHPLPTPQPGAPSQAHTDAVEDAGAWVPLATHHDGPTVNIIRALGLAPAERKTFWRVFRQHYTNTPDPSYQGRAISRPQMELVASRISAANQCFY